MMWLITAFALAAEPPSPRSPTQPAPAPESPASEAEAPDTAAGPPLAIPAPGEPPPRPADGRRGSQGRQHTAALRTYQREALTVRTLSEYYIQPGMTTYWGGGGRWGWGGGWGWATSTPSTVYRVDEWAVFEGDARLDVPTLLDRLGDSTGKQDLERRIRTNRTVGTTLTTLGVVGLVGSVAGMIAAQNVSTADDYATLTTGALISGASGLGLLVSGSFPSSRSRRLGSLAELTMDRKQVEQHVATYDEQLADRLGLDPEEAFRLEQRARRPDHP